MNSMMKKGFLVVLSGPSGVGKGTVKKILTERIEEMCVAVTATTRLPRPGEVEGKSYYFKTVEEFERLVAEDAFIEHVTTYGNHYGSLKSEVRRLIDLGKIVIMEIDVKGAVKIKEQMPEALFIFVMPPSKEELERRIRGRATETDDVIKTRLSIVDGELAMADRYDYVVVNDEVNNCATKVEAIIRDEAKRRLN